MKIWKEMEQQMRAERKSQMNGEINASTEETESELGLGIKKINLGIRTLIQPQNRQKCSTISLVRFTNKLFFIASIKKTRKSASWTTKVIINRKHLQPILLP